MSETSFCCMKCGAKLITLEKGSKYSPKFRAICDGCIPKKQDAPPFGSSFGDMFGGKFK